MSGLTFGQYLVALLADYGIDHVFGIPGVHNVELYRGLAASTIRHVTPRHEQGAGFMADGFARVSGRPAACFVISGPGLTNIATAMGQAYGDSIPMLVISTGQPAGRAGTGDGYLHEHADQQAATRPVCAFSHRLNSLEAAPAVIARAFSLFASARPRPVHIDIPTDLLSRDAAHLPPPRAAILPRRPAPNAEAIAQAAALLGAARRPLILAGGGCHGAGEALTALAERLGAPVCLTVNARGLMARDHALAVSQSASLPAIRQLIADSDAILAVGTELGQTDYDMYDEAALVLPPGAPLVRIDIDSQQIMRNARPDLALVGDAGQALNALVQACPPRPAADGPARAQAARQAALQNLSPTYRSLCRLLDAIRDSLPGVILVGDSTQITYAGCLGFAADGPASFFNSATGYGTLGYALPAAIGARLGSAAVGEPRPVVVLVGDGGLQFCLAELGSAMEAGCPLVLLLWNNHGYGEIKTYMVGRAIEPVGVDLYTPDFAALATAFGWRTSRIDHPDALPSLLKQAHRSGRATLLEIAEADFLPKLLAKG